jgi:microcin C transport system substrate-binding protein
MPQCIRSPSTGSACYDGGIAASASGAVRAHSTRGSHGLRRGEIAMRLAAVVAILALALGQSVSAAEPKVTVSHGLTLLDELKYPEGFKQLDYVNPNAPKGGTVRLYSIGSFDSFNNYIIKGDPAEGLGLATETLLTSPPDEVSSEYGLIAETVEVPEDLSFVVFNLRREARFHDGTPITADDVLFSFNILKEKGAPFFKFYYANIVRAEKLGSHRVKFHFTGPPNRELPQITGQLPVLPKHYWERREFDQTTLDPPVGSGPYKIARFEPGRYIEYERVADYWGRDLPINRGRYNIDRIRYDYYRDQTVALEAFKAQQYDYRQENSAKDWATGYDFPAMRQGLAKKEEVAHARPTGMQAFAFNLRREKFRDRSVRWALAHAFDFEWANANLFYGQYTRTNSFFSNSELAARELPSKEELALLEPFRGKVPEEVFSKVYEAPRTDGSGSNRENLRTAVQLLRAAGWQIKDNKLIDPKSGRPLEIEFLLNSPQFERIVAPFIEALKRLGVQGRIRTVDPSQYINRVRDFDFDVIVQTFPQSESPGNEQRDFWSSDAAARPGSRNVVGIKDPVVDALVEKIVEARDRRSLVVATRALDRVLLWNHFVIPQWHVRIERIAYWNKFVVPQHPKYGDDILSWWIDPAKDAQIAAERERLKRE